ncbi:hypothetical protein [Nocardia mexicana]|uniref:Uncharacterized protein n=1 Tax=Nocardia mexicana TaxID=279262 RepID=A0A370H8N3_9NOCA|nr:hypothetical protein [Nocardia mexicana]RDI52746.1 hypothetical protein DFR68_103131 [Nocardia mexicana]
MERRSRIFEFPGGFLEVEEYGDDPEDGPGVYMEFYLPDESESERGGQAEPEAS